MKSPQFITVTLPLQGSPIADAQAEKGYDQDLTGGLVILEAGPDGHERGLMPRRQARGPLA